MQLITLTTSQLGGICHDAKTEKIQIEAQNEIILRADVSSNVLKFLCTQGQTDFIKAKARQILSTKVNKTSTDLLFLYHNFVSAEEKIKFAALLIDHPKVAISDLKFLCLNSEYPQVRLDAIEKIKEHKRVTGLILFNILTLSKDPAVREIADLELDKQHYIYELSLIGEPE
jgi:hypothetical protein